MMRSWSLSTFTLLVSILALSACAASSARHPLAGVAQPDRAQAGYWLFTHDGFLVVRLTSGDKPHRYQGSITAVDGKPVSLLLERPALAQQVAAQDASVQFDIELGRAAEEGFRVRLDGRCARFDLYVDGARHVGRVHLGRRKNAPQQIPFERCP